MGCDALGRPSSGLCFGRRSLCATPPAGRVGGYALHEAYGSAFGLHTIDPLHGILWWRLFYHCFRISAFRSGTRQQQDERPLEGHGLHGRCCEGLVCTPSHRDSIFRLFAQRLHLHRFRFQEAGSFSVPLGALLGHGAWPEQAVFGWVV